jgi:crotonobetainyl-CoA:carnitine CoA-transferase CaiB-like acyl-CoA transferase
VSDSGNAQTRGPLHGVRVVDFSLYLPGPYATRLLKDLGAEVEKVEPPSGDPIVGFMPGVYEFLNRDKSVTVLNLKQPDDLASAHELIRGADVVVEGFRPGVADRLGIGFEQCSDLRPGVIYASLSGYGQSGPERDRPGHDIGYEASGGGFAAHLIAGEPPAVPNVPVGDLGGSLFAATTICAHLADGAHHESIHLDVALQEAVIHLSATRWGGALHDDSEVDVEQLASFAPGMGFFRTRDQRWIALAAVEDSFWERMCAALGEPELAQPPYVHHAGRMKHRTALRERIASRVAECELEELKVLLGDHDVPLDLVRSAEEVMADPHLNEREIFRHTGSGLHVEYPVIQGRTRSFAAQQAEAGAR